MRDSNACQVVRLLLSLGLVFAVLFNARAHADETTRRLQEELRKRHLYFGDIDGRFTPEVAAALKSYQQRKGFAPSGQADAITLRSLALAPPAPAGDAVLPDVTVLRSDEGSSIERRENDAPSALAPEREGAPFASTSPPPPDAAACKSIDPEQTGAVQAFIERYLRAGQNNDLPAEMAFYGDRVDYFEDGRVDRRFIQEDVLRYERRWPERHFDLELPLSITKTSATNAAGFKVSFRYRFSVKNSRYAASGEADTQYVLAGGSPDDLRIISLQEQRVRP